MKKEIPDYYTFCQNDSCPKANECLRNIFYKKQVSDDEIISIINPQKYPSENSQCTYFVTSQKIRMAWGIKNLFTFLPYDSAKAIKAELLKYFGRTKYYRFFREEIPVRPEYQAEIKRIFQKHGITEEPGYTRFSEEYNF